MRFLTIEYVNGQSQVRCQVTQATAPFQSGVIESRMNAENALALSQHNAIEAMKAAGLLTEESAKNLSDVKAAYAKFTA